MEVLSAPRVMISAEREGVGKSLVALGIAIQLRKRNISVSCCVSGLNLIQAIILKRICGRAVRVLDEHLLTRSQILNELFFSGTGADLVVIEGQSGLYSGMPSGEFFKGSDSELAALTNSPVALVVDARGLGANIAALVKGYSNLIPGVRVIGAIANRTTSQIDQHARHMDLFNDALALAKLPALLGGIPELPGNVPIPSKILSQAKNQSLLPRQFMVDLGKMAEDYINLDQIIDLAQRADPVRLEDLRNQPFSRRTRIAVSEDSAFNLGFQNNLELLRYFGAELVPFSPLADIALPRNVGALYFTGGYLGEYGLELISNQSMKRAIRDFADKGGVVYAEGGGCAFLCEEFKIDPEGESFEGIGVLSAVATPKVAPVRYCESVTVEESILGRQGLIVKGISTNDWEIREKRSMVKGLRVSEEGSQSYAEGFTPGAQIMATTALYHWGSNPAMAKNIVDAAEVNAKIS